MGTTTVDDDFTYTPTVKPCSLMRAVDEAGLRDKTEGAIQQIKEHREANGTKSPDGPTASWLRGVLEGRGIYFDEQVIRKHVGQKCSCYRAAK